MLAKQLRKEIIFEKTITRDRALFVFQIWIDIWTQSFRKQYGWAYSNIVLVNNNGATSIYRPFEEHTQGMLELVFEKQQKDSEWIEKEAQKVEKRFEKIKKYLFSFDKQKIEALSEAEIKEALQKVWKYYSSLGPAFVIMLWFPINIEKHKREEEFSEQIKRAAKSRERVDVVNTLVDNFCREIIQTILKRNKLENRNLEKYLSYSELLAFLDGKKVDINLIESRKKYYLLSSHGVLSSPLKEYLAKNFYSLKKDSPSKKGAAIIGTTAYPGKVSGTVRLVVIKEEFSKVKQGDILVSPQATPDFVPLLKKIIGIITDEGGSTCHTAILAREHKIPCIVGAKNATSLLKDGQLVTLNATNGTVSK